MKQILKQILYILSMTVFLVSCEDNSLTDNPPDQPIGITFKGAITSRATDTAFEKDDEISITAYNSDGSIYAQNISYVYSSNLFSSDSPIKHSSSEQELAFRAVYPYLEIPDNKIVNFSVQNNQGVDNGYTLSDMMLSYVGATTSSSPELVFDHLMTKFVLNITSVDVEMVNVVVTLTAIASFEYDLSTLNASTVGSTQTITMANNGVNSYKAIIVPQEVEADVAFGQISVNGESYELSFSKRVELLGGSQYSIDATIIDGKIIFDTPIINDWEDGELPEFNNNPEVEDSIVPDGYTGVYTAEDIYNMRNDLAASYILMKDVDLSAYSNWEPIGSYTASTPFTGVFDGNNKTISGLTINSIKSYLGLFGYAYGATIENLTLKDVSVVGVEYIGAIVGYLQGVSTIENCGVESGSLVGSSSYVGGITGRVYDTSSTSKITSCYNKADVQGRYYVAGIVGSSYAKVTDCYNSGKVVSSYTSICTIGGIVGVNYSSVNYCYNSGDITGNSRGVGGIAGQCYYGSSIYFSYNSGDISGTYQVGGIAGGAVANTKIISCYNSGDVNGDYYIGGIIGDFNAGSSSSTSYITSTITACYNVGHISGNTSIGGIAGRTLSNTATTTTYPYKSFASITSCYNTGYIEGGSDTGAIVGWNGILGEIDGSFYIAHNENQAISGIGLNEGDGDASAAANITELNSKVSEMNTAANYSYFVKGSPTSSVLPYLSWEVE